MPLIGKRCVLAIFALFMQIAPAVRAQSTDGAVYVATYIDVQPSSISQGLPLITQYAEQSRRDAGSLTADVFQELGRSNRFVVIEAWRDQPSFESHEKAAHTAE